jgi:glycosyltransferase involved in cell wall biosynthesis
MKKIALITDAWHPQVNGVVRVTETLAKMLESRGIEVKIIEPSQFTTIPLPLYQEYRLALFAKRRVAKELADFKPDAIHLMTEGTLGFAARTYCLKQNLPFTTWYHTHFDYYISMRIPGLLSIVKLFVRTFHNAATSTFVSTESLKKDLHDEGFTRLAVVPLGVDTERFKRNLAPAVPVYQKPVYVFFSRLAVEKSPEEFLQLELQGTKLVIGDGPDRERLEKKYSVANGGDATFVGYKKGQELVDYLSSADVMIFPSRTETFGLAALEALACGVPVAAHNVLGPRDIVTEGVDGYLSANLAEAAQKCLLLEREACRQKALKYSWKNSVDVFLQNLVPIKDAKI